MSIRPVTLAVLFACATAAFAADAPIQFSGVMGTGKDVRVALTNPTTRSTQWIPIGGSFQGYVISSYDAKTEALTVTKDGQQVRLVLKEGKTPPGPGPKPSPVVERAIMNNLRQLAAAADQFYLENGKTITSYEQLVGPTKYVKQISPVDGENYQALTFMQGQTLKVTTSSGHSLSYAP